MINKVILIGNLGRDPEVRMLDSGVSVAKFSVATNESYKDKNNEWQTLTEWHNVVLWRGLAERAEKQLAKGKLVFIEGKLTHRKWQDKDGNDRYSTEVVANTFRLLEKREDRQGGLDSFPSALDEPSSSLSTPSVIQGAPESTPAAEDDLPF